MKYMYEMVPGQLKAIISEKKLIAVLIIEKAVHVRPLMQTLQDAGIRVVELTLRTSVAMEALTIIKNEFPNITLGAGTVLTISQLEEVKQRGADFAVSPGLNESILKKSLEIEIPFFPGVLTPSEIEKAINYGCRTLKFFPSEPIGGLKYLKSVNAPYQHLSLSYIPLGGINIDNLEHYIKSPIVCAVGGSWLAPSTLINQENWKQIHTNITEAIAVLESSK